jgi:hypothetical protein
MALVPLEWMSGWCGIRQGEQRIAVMDSLLFSLRSFFRGAHTPRLAHSAPPRVEGLICLRTQTEGRILVPFVSALCTFLTPHIP